MEQQRQHYGITLGILTLAGIAFSLQQTMVFPALATFQEEFDTSTAWVTWVLTGFLVAAAVTTPILGRLGDQYGKERMLLVALTIFFVGSAAAAFAWNIWSLIGFRALAGAGGALFPLSFAIIRDEFPPERAKVGYGLLSAVFGVGGGIGIVASGLIIDHIGWRWLFILGAIPVGLSILLVHRYVPESPIKSPSRPDVPGALLLSGALLALMLGLTEGASMGWTSAPIVALGLLSLLLFAAWARWETHTDAPMVDMRTLAHRPVLLTNVVTLIAGFALFSCFVLVPTFVQAPEARGYGFSATATTVGVYLVPGSVALLFAGPVAGLIGRRFGSKWPLSLGMAIVAVAAVFLATTHEEPWQVVSAYTLLCVGVGLAFAAMVALIAENVSEHETGVATGMNTVVRMIGAVVGGQIGAALLTESTIRGVPAESAFTLAFSLSAVAGLAAALIALAIGVGRRTGTPLSAN